MFLEGSLSIPEQMKLRAVQQGLQRPVLAQVLQQSLHILQMPLLDLKVLLERELESNPALEETLRTSSLAPWEGPQGQEQEEEEGFDTVVSVAEPPPTLSDLLHQQLSLLASTLEESMAGQAIIDNLNEDGYLHEPSEEIAASLQLPVETVERGLKLVQQCDPVGVGARTLKECLLLQLRDQGSEKSLAGRLVAEDTLDDLAHRQYSRLARRMGATVQEVEEAARKISTLSPWPGRLVCQESPCPLIPDIVITKDRDGQFQIALRDDELPALRISPTFQKMLVDPTVTEETRTFVRQKIQAAVTILRGIEQRHQTMRRIARVLVELQPEFLEYGLIYLKPMTYRQMAVAIGRHPSTVARAVAHKVLECPAGLFPFSDLFSAALPAEAAGPTSSQSVKAQLQEWIASEDRQHPFSDDQLVTRFQAFGIQLARRTIAKYRSQLRIPPAYQRRFRVCV